MKCSKCGNELKEGQLYCEKCGYEIQIVPNFEPELEHEIHTSLTGVAENVKDIENPDNTNQELHKRSKSFIHRLYSKQGILACILAGFLVVLFIIIGFHTFYNGNYQYQYEQATKSANVKDYKNAIQHMRRAIELQPEDEELCLMLADYYYKNGEKENALITLINGINSYQETTEAYKKVISIYSKDKEYEKINELLLNCKDQEVLTIYKDYTAFPPEYSLPDERYQEKMFLELQSDAKGTIYYTIDGTEPSKISTEYTEPIQLELGTYTIKAVFVNQYGIMSDCAEKSYIIESTTPLQPDVSPYSGAYNSPQMITVNNDDAGKIYFTIDGSTPDEKSDSYTGSITMPLGTSRFKFITYSEDGTTSDVTERIYDLKLNHVDVSAQDAINITNMFLLQNGYLLDTEGHNVNGTDRYVYSCTTAITKNNATYYLVTENVLNEAGNYAPTGNIFTVDAMNGAMGKAQIASDGTIQVTLY